MKPVRIGMIGYGGIGRVHALAYRSLPFHYGLAADSVQLVGVATGASGDGTGRCRRDRL